MSWTLKPKKYLNPDQGVESVEDALAGAQGYHVRMDQRRSAGAGIHARPVSRTRVCSRLSGVRGKDVQGSKFRDYARMGGASERTAPSHRVLASAPRRAGRLSHFSGCGAGSRQHGHCCYIALFVKGSGSTSAQVTMAIQDSFTRLLSLSMETEARLQTKAIEPIRRPSRCLPKTFSNCSWPRPWAKRPCWPLIRGFVPVVKSSVWIGRVHSQSYGCDLSKSGTRRRLQSRRDTVTELWLSASKLRRLPLATGQQAEKPKRLFGR